MLKNTFLHLNGYGFIKERRLWHEGIKTWEDLHERQESQLAIFNNFYVDLLKDSFIALNERNADFFAERIPSGEYYRIIQTYPKDTIFLDIETTGLSRYYDKITLVGWSKDDKHGIYIQGDSPISLLEAINNSKAIFTTYYDKTVHNYY